MDPNRPRGLAAMIRRRDALGIIGVGLVGMRMRNDREPPRCCTQYIPSEPRAIARVPLRDSLPEQMKIRNSSTFFASKKGNVDIELRRLSIYTVVEIILSEMDKVSLSRSM